MNTVIQNILVGIAIALAIWYLLNTYGILPKKKTAGSKACGQDDCGCH
ncbi:FeoB-associated Cys-rich membrane protein [Psychroserpens sp. Hel_I_66]|nr:FeoB-associated Cys-rich membrane protein [Psychroserpens sp. Hel_I_66]